MTGDDLVTLVTNAASDEDALNIARSASAQARNSAADILYIDADTHGKPWVCAAIVREARS